MFGLDAKTRRLVGVLCGIGPPAAGLMIFVMLICEAFGACSCMENPGRLPSNEEVFKLNCEALLNLSGLDRRIGLPSGVVDTSAGVGMPDRGRAGLGDEPLDPTEVFWTLA
jgi:hypothetical protein